MNFETLVILILFVILYVATFDHVHRKYPINDFIYEVIDRNMKNSASLR